MKKSFLICFEAGIHDKVQCQVTNLTTQNTNTRPQHCTTQNCTLQANMPQDGCTSNRSIIHAHGYHAASLIKSRMLISIKSGFSQLASDRRAGRPFVRTKTRRKFWPRIRRLPKILDRDFNNCLGPGLAALLHFDHSSTVRP